VNLKSGLVKLLYMPICRFYARHILGDKPADSVMHFLSSFQFWNVHRYWPNFLEPKSFNEKLWYHMMHSRDPLLTLISDKLLVREYVSEKVGQSYLIPLLWNGNNPEDIPFDKLPMKYVIKTNHGCGYVIIIKDNLIDQPFIKRKLEKWMRVNFGKDKYLGTEWAYNNIKPSIIIEQFVGENDKAPVDYKFYCFSGHVEFLTLHFDRFYEHKTRSFDRNFEPYDFRYNFAKWDGECKRPNNFELMVQLAELLSQDFDFIRVDLYNVNERIYFSELTPYPGGVSTKFLPLQRDYILGKKWKWKEIPQ